MRKGQVKPYPSAGRVFKQWRNNVTQQCVADLLKVHVQYVSNWERGECLPNKKAFKIIVKHMTTMQTDRLRWALHNDIVAPMFKGVHHAR